MIRAILAGSTTAPNDHSPRPAVLTSMQLKRRIAVDMQCRAPIVDAKPLTRGFGRRAAAPPLMRHMTSARAVLLFADIVGCEFRLPGSADFVLVGFDFVLALAVLLVELLCPELADDGLAIALGKVADSATFAVFHHNLRAGEA